MDRWLTRDIIGHYSRIVYGRIHDKVEYYGKKNETMHLVALNGEKFHVKEEDITTVNPNPNEIEAAAEALPVIPAAASLRKGKAGKWTKNNKKGTPTNIDQKTLF